MMNNTNLKSHTITSAVVFTTRPGSADLAEHDHLLALLFHAGCKGLLHQLDGGFAGPVSAIQTAQVPGGQGCEHQTPIDEVGGLDVMAVHWDQLMGRGQCHWQGEVLPLAPDLELQGPGHINSGVRSVMPDISSYQTKHPNTHGSFLQCSNELKGQQAVY